VSVDSLSKMAFDDGLFKDEVDLNRFLRWILRCQAKRDLCPLFIFGATEGNSPDRWATSLWDRALSVFQQ
jgi:hypothetical protein